MWAKFIDEWGRTRAAIQGTQHHYLKILPEYYLAIEDGTKTFEVRFNDRDYHVGDVLHLQEFVPPSTYTSRELVKTVTYILDDSNFCKEGFVVMGLK